MTTCNFPPSSLPAVSLQRDGREGTYRPIFSGIVTDKGTLACTCEACKEERTHSLTEFEVHCGGTHKKPADHTWVIELGLNLRDLALMTCRCLGLGHIAAGTGQGRISGAAVKAALGESALGTGEGKKRSGGGKPRKSAAAAAAAGGAEGEGGTAALVSSRPRGTGGSPAGRKPGRLRAAGSSTETESDVETETETEDDLDDFEEQVERTAPTGGTARQRAAAAQGAAAVATAGVAGWDRHAPVPAGTCTVCLRALPENYKELAAAPVNATVSASACLLVSLRLDTAWIETSWARLENLSYCCGIYGEACC